MAVAGEHSHDQILLLIGNCKSSNVVVLTESVSQRQLSAEQDNK